MYNERVWIINAEGKALLKHFSNMQGGLNRSDGRKHNLAASQKLDTPSIFIVIHNELL